MLRIALIELRRFYAEQFIGRNPKCASQGNEGGSGWELRFRFVIGDRALGCLRYFGELDLGQAARLPERNQALAESGLCWFLGWHLRSDCKVHFRNLPNYVVSINVIRIYSRTVLEDHKKPELRRGIPLFAYHSYVDSQRDDAQ